MGLINEPMKLVVIITADLEQGLMVAQAWQAAGTPGVTLLRTLGLVTLQQAAQRGDIELPSMISSMEAVMAAIIGNIESDGEMILSVTPASMVDRLVAEANRVLGDMSAPGNGILFVIDIERAIGIRFHTLGE